MSDDLDLRLRAGLAELAEPGDPDGAPDRVRTRIEKRRRRRQRNFAFVSIVTLAFVMTTAQLVSWQDSPGRRVVSVSPTTEHPNPLNEASAKSPRKTKVIIDSHGRRITVPADEHPSTPATNASKGTQSSSNGNASVNPGAGTAQGPANTPGQQPSPPPVIVGPTGPPVSVQPGGGPAFPGAGPSHLVVVLDDAGLHSSAALIDAGTVAVTFLDKRHGSSSNVSISSTDATINVARDATDSYVLRTPQTYTLGVNGGASNIVSFDIGVPAGAGGSTDPAGVINITEAGGVMTFPNRDTIDDVISLPDVPPGAPIVLLKAGTYTLNFNNTDKDRQRVQLDVASINVAVPRHKMVPATGDIPAGTYVLQSTNLRTHTVTTAYLYVQP